MRDPLDGGTDYGQGCAWTIWLPVLLAMLALAALVLVVIGDG